MRLTNFHLLFGKAYYYVNIRLNVLSSDSARYVVCRFYKLTIFLFVILQRCTFYSGDLVVHHTHLVSNLYFDILEWQKRLTVRKYLLVP